MEEGEWIHAFEEDCEALDLACKVEFCIPLPILPSFDFTLRINSTRYSQSEGGSTTLAVLDMGFLSRGGY